MTNEEAIKWLVNLKQDIGQLRHEDLWPYAQAIDEIIDMLDEHEPRVLALDEIKEGEPVRHGHWNGWITTHWTKKCDDNGDPIYKEHTYYVCSGCRRRTIIKSAYCPACGRKMDEVSK